MVEEAGRAEEEGFHCLVPFASLVHKAMIWDMVSRLAESKEGGSRDRLLPGVWKLSSTFLKLATVRVLRPPEASSAAVEG
jgi:hypothetical protein